MNLESEEGGRGPELGFRETGTRTRLIALGSRGPEPRAPWAAVPWGWIFELQHDLHTVALETLPASYSSRSAILHEGPQGHRLATLCCTLHPAGGPLSPALSTVPSPRVSRVGSAAPEPR